MLERRVVFVAIAALAASSSAVEALSPHDKAPGVQPRERAKQSSSDQIQPEQKNPNAKPLATLIYLDKSDYSNENAGRNTKQVDYEADSGKEYWPPIGGYKVKVSDSAIVFLTFVLAVATIVLAWKTWGLDRSTRLLWQDSKEQIAATQRAADAAVTSSEAAKVALTGLDRPYIFPIIEEHTIPVGLTFGDVVSRGDQFSITYSYKNFGRSPAVIRETAFKTRIFRGHENIGPMRRQATNFIAQAKSRSWVIASGEKSGFVTEPLDITANPSMIAFLKAKMGSAYIHPSEIRDPAEQANVAVYDRIRYEDMIGNTYMLFVGYLLTGSDFHLFWHEQETHGREAKDQS